MREQVPGRHQRTGGMKLLIVGYGKMGRLIEELALEQALEVARTFRPLSEGEVATLLARTAEVALRGEFEPFKTSSIFDATAQHPEWLGEEPERLQKLMPT